jgi:hypothetical protein
MPTKRPDQLPEGEDFDFDDILMVEKDPDSPDRKLYKTTLRELMEAALQIDPQRMGNNAIVGTQSEFEWLIEQMKKLSDSPIVNVNDYSEFDSPTKELEQSYITPTPTPSASVLPTPTPTPTVSTSARDPNAPIPSTTPTPTPSVSPKPLEKELQIEIKGRQDIVLLLPEQYKPERFGYSNWRIKPGQDTDNIYINYIGFFPDEFINTGLNEKLLSLIQVNNESLRVEVGLLDGDNLLLSSQGLIEGSILKITLIYS